MANLARRIREIGMKRFLKKATFYDEVYTIGIRKKQPVSGDALFHTAMPFVPITQNLDIWMADPLLFTHEGKDWLFVELFEKASHLGRIAVIDPDSEEKQPAVIIQEPFHMSFPMIFTWNDRIFMIPETSGNRSIRLYQCVDFPYQWKLVSVFPVNALIVDSVVLENDADHVTLLASETNPDNELLVRFVTYTIHTAQNGYHLEYSPSSRPFSYAERNGGYPVTRNGRQYLVTQNSSAIDYGVSLSRSTYEQGQFTIHETIDAASGQMRGIGSASAIGIHTYSEGSTYEVIDMRYLKFDLLLNIRRILYKVHK